MYKHVNQISENAKFCTSFLSFMFRESKIVVNMNAWVWCHDTDVWPKQMIVPTGTREKSSDLPSPPKTDFNFAP